MFAFRYLSIFSFFLWNVTAITYKTASFIHPASPFDKKTHSDSVATGYGLYDVKKSVKKRKVTSLFAKKKKAGGAATKKMQVKLLKNVPGTGQAGQVIMVTPAFFNNKLRPNSSAKIISDDQVEEDKIKAAEREKEIKDAISAVQEALGDVNIVIKRKAGPGGHLFGGIGNKMIIKELSQKVPNDIWKKKGVKVNEMLDENGKKIKGDIKEVGKFTAKINLSPDTISKVNISVEAQ